MRTHQPQNFALLFISLGIICIPRCFAEEAKTAIMFEKEVSAAEDLWKAGKTTDYYVLSAKLSVDMKSNKATVNLNKTAAKLFENLISKESDPKKVGTYDLDAMRKLAPYLTSHDDVTVEERRLNAQLLCRYLGKIRKEMIPNYKSKPYFANVSPPQGMKQMAFAGMNPETIKDPIMRAKYKTAIQENQDNARSNVRQSALKTSDLLVREDVVDYITKTFNAEDMSSSDFTECIKNAELTTREREELIKRVSQKHVNK